MHSRLTDQGCGKQNPMAQKTNIGGKKGLKPNVSKTLEAPP